MGENEGLKAYISDYSEMFAEFLQELEAWCENGREPASGDQDLRHYLDLEEKRLKKRGLSMKARLKTFGDVLQTSKLVSAMSRDPFHLARYSRSQHSQSVEKTISYKRNGQEIYRKKDDYDVILTIMEAASEEQASIAGMDYVCPACGGISKIRALQEEGCPYCGGHFIMSELFPKVSNYWFNKSVSIPEKFDSDMKKWIWGTISVVALSFFIYLMFADRRTGLGLKILKALLGGAFAGAIWGYMLFCGKILFRLGRIAVRGTKVSLGTRKGKAKIDRFLSQFDPAFSYEYFQGKVLSLVRSIILTDDPSNLPQYGGKALDPEFERYLHINYAGGIGLDHAQVKNGRIMVSLDIFLLNTVDSERGIEERLEKLRVKMEHLAAFRVDPEFSIQRVSCKTCGSSFNALKEKHCPYCGTAYQPEEADWLVTEISR